MRSRKCFVLVLLVFSACSGDASSLIAARGQGGAAGIPPVGGSGGITSPGAGGWTDSGNAGGYAGAGGSAGAGGNRVDAAAGGITGSGGTTIHCDLFPSLINNKDGCTTGRAEPTCSEDRDYWNCAVGSCGPSFTSCYTVTANTGACRYDFSGACANVAQCLIGCNCSANAWRCEADCVAKHVISNSECLDCAVKMNLCKPSSNCTPAATCTRPGIDGGATDGPRYDGPAVDGPWPVDMSIYIDQARPIDVGPPIDAPRPRG